MTFRFQSTSHFNLYRSPDLVRLLMFFSARKDALKTLHLKEQTDIVVPDDCTQRGMQMNYAVYIRIKHPNMFRLVQLSLKANILKNKANLFELYIYITQI